ncbi:hypothetical protein ACRYI5_00175, partial [Furfurilactobacillus sp. WILCCON 0119]
MEEKIHFKSYKIGKIWVNAAVLMGVSSGLMMAANMNASADTTVVSSENQQQANTQQPDQLTSSTVPLSASNSDLNAQRVEASQTKAAVEISQPADSSSQVTSVKDANQKNDSNNEVMEQKESQAAPVEQSANEPTVYKTEDATNLAVQNEFVANTNTADVKDDATNASVTLTGDSTDAESLIKNNQVFAYNVSVKNDNSAGLSVTKGTTFTFSPVADGRIDLAASLKFVTLNDPSANFSAVQDSNGAVILTTLKDLTPGAYNFALNFLNNGVAYNWDGKNSGTPANVSLNVSSSAQNFTSTLMPSSFDLEAKKDDPNQSFGGVPGYFGGALVSDPGYPISGIKPNGIGQIPFSQPGHPDEVAYRYVPQLDENGNYYMVFKSNYNTYYTNNTVGVLSAEMTGGTLNQAKTRLIYDSDGQGKNVDITSDPDVIWTWNGNTAQVDFSKYMQSHDIKYGTLSGFNLVSYVDVSNINDIVSFSGGLKWDGWNDGLWHPGAPTVGFFQNVSGDTFTPYFRGSDMTIYNTDTLDPKTNVAAFVNNTNITSSIEIANYNGYPENGVNPAVGNYTIEYSVTTADGHTANFSRTIHVLANQKSIDGHDYTMHVGDATPTVDNFGGQATDIDGKAEAVSVDLSGADVTKAGTYDVTLTTTDGQSKTVKLTVLANQKSIDGRDYTMHVGDATPTVDNFGGQATDIDG